MSRHAIENLPTEILTDIFSRISEDESKQSPKPSIKNVRLVSQRFKQVSSAFLVDRVTVRSTSTSLSCLEAICLHPDFHKSVTHVVFDLAYYDVKIAQDVNRFGNQVSGQLWSALERMERTGRHSKDEDPETRKKRLARLWHIAYGKDFERLDRYERDGSRAKAHQKNVISLHKEYIRLTADQEDVRLENRHVRRIAAALKKLSGVHSIHLSDSLTSKYGRTQHNVIHGSVSLDHPEFFVSALAPERWRGATSPPIEMVADLLSHLGNVGLRPRSFTYHVATPRDLRILRPTRIQSVGIQRLISKSSDIDLSFQAWDCKHKGALDDGVNDLSRNEILSLGSLATALTSTSKLEQLTLGFHSYPCSHQGPIANLSDLLPIHSRLWPQLSSIDLRSLPCDLEDLVALVDAHHQTIKSFSGSALYLRTGDWDQVLDVLRGLKSLEIFRLNFPRGGRYDDWIPYPSEEAEQYVLGKVAENPL